MQESTEIKNTPSKLSIENLIKSLDQKTDNVISRLEKINKSQSIIEDKFSNSDCSSEEKKIYESQIEYLESIIIELENKVIESNIKIKQLEDFVIQIY